MDTLRTAIPSRGLFLFPAPKPDGSMPGPGPISGLLLLRSGVEGVTPVALGAQLAADIAVAFVLAALLIGAGAAGFRKQWMLALAAGIIPFLRADLPMWIWYGFPRRYVAAQLAIDVVAFALAGFLIAALTRPKAKANAAAA